jgi:hypothetical protein
MRSFGARTRSATVPEVEIGTFGFAREAKEELPAPHTYPSRRKPGELASQSSGTEGWPQDADAYATVTQLNVETRRAPRAQVLTRMAGTVQRVNSDSFIAILQDQDNPGAPAESAEFDKAILTESDERLLAEGAVFYFNVGYRTDEKGTRSAFSEVRFRRLPEWTAKDIESIRTTDDIDDLFA